MLGDFTGPAALAAKGIQAGTQFAVTEANNRTDLKFKLSVTYTDTGGDPTKAPPAMSQVAATSENLAALYSPLTGSALAMAPIAQREKLPMIVAQAGGNGVIEAGNYIFRTTAPQRNYTYLMGEYLKSKGVKTMGLVYPTNNPTQVDLAENIYPQLAKQYGFSIVSIQKITTADTDFSSVVTQLVKANPDVVNLQTLVGQAGQIVTQMRRAGYKGDIIGSAGFAGGALTPLGDLANGIAWPGDFSAASTDPLQQKFTKNYTSATGKTPDAFTAEGYDLVQLLIAGTKNAGSKVTRDTLRDGIEKATKAGIDGATGHLQFLNRDARVPGVLIVWQSGKETVVNVPHKQP
jgi:branched-chain amino acid transport system substrate-binding protein